MISICTVTADPVGNVIFDDTLTEAEELSARVSRVKTLDGGCEILHSGVSESDRTMRVVAYLSAAKAQRLKTLFATESLIITANNDGVYLCAIGKYKDEGGKIAISLLVKEKI